MKQIEVIISDLKTSPYQTREIKSDDADIKELATSIKNVGLMHPIVVRKICDDNGVKQFEIIAGHRRAKAAEVAGQKTIQANLIDADDRKAAEMCILENMDRKDLTLHEEVQGVKNLLKGDLSNEQVATRIGRTRAWVRAREVISELPEEYRNELKPGGKLSNWDFEAVLAVAKINACAPKEAVDEVIDNCSFGDRIPTAYDIEKYAKNNLCGNLQTSAIFDTKECEKCYKRTGAQADLFGDIKELGVCCDKKCWKEKTIAVRQKELDDFLKENKSIINDVCRSQQGKLLFLSRDVEGLELPPKSEESYYWYCLEDEIPQSHENDYKVYTRVVYFTHEFDHKLEKNIWKCAIKYLGEIIKKDDEEVSEEEQHNRECEQQAKERTQDAIEMHIEKYIDQVVAGETELFKSISELCIVCMIEQFRDYDDDELKEKLIEMFDTGIVKKEQLHYLIHHILVDNSDFENNRRREIREGERNLDAVIHTALMRAMYGENWADKLDEMHEENLKEIKEKGK